MGQSKSGAQNHDVMICFSTVDMQTSLYLRQEWILNELKLFLTTKEWL